MLQVYRKEILHIYEENERLQKENQELKKITK